jgi:hypothetical protein
MKERTCGLGCDGKLKPVTIIETEDSVNKGKTMLQCEKCGLKQPV